MAGDVETFQAELNAIIEDQAWRFGPVRVRRVEHLRPRRTITHRIVDANGRRMLINADLSVEHAAKLLHNRHRMRLGLDHEEQRVRRLVGDAFEGMLTRPARVMLADADGCERNSFLCFGVEVDLLDETLSSRPHLLDYRPYSDGKIETLEGPRVNLNDLDASDSPLSRTVRHAQQSEIRHILVMRDVRPEAFGDATWFRKLEALANRVTLVVEMCGAPTSDHGWKTVELTS